MTEKYMEKYMEKYDKLEQILRKMEKYNINLNGVNTMLFIGIYEELVKLNKFNNPVKENNIAKVKKGWEEVVTACENPTKSK